jgi:hypothetical protein
MSDLSKKHQPAKLADLPEQTRLTIESEFRRLKAENLSGRDLRTCYCQSLRKIIEILYPAGAGLEEPVIDDLIELTFEAANRIELRQPSLLARGFVADVMDLNDQLRRTSHPFDRPMPPERPHEYSPHGLATQSPLRHRRETFGQVEVWEGTRDAFREYLQPEIERVLADILKLRAGGKSTQRAGEGLADRRAATPNARRGYRKEVRQWMELKTVRTVPEAARRLGVGHDTLKSIMSSKGEKRYSDDTLNDILEKTREKSGL